MRKTVIYCDKCGAEIVGKPMQIIPEYSDRGDGSYEPYSGDEEELPQWISMMLSKEFCEKCAKGIFDFALNIASTDEKESDKGKSKSDSGDLDYSAALDRLHSEN